MVSDYLSPADKMILAGPVMIGRDGRDSNAKRALPVLRLHIHNGNADADSTSITLYVNGDKVTQMFCKLPQSENISLRSIQTIVSSVLHCVMCCYVPVSSFFLPPSLPCAPAIQHIQGLQYRLGQLDSCMDNSLQGCQAQGCGRQYGALLH